MKRRSRGRSLYPGPVPEGGLPKKRRAESGSGYTGARVVAARSIVKEVERLEEAAGVTG